MRGLLPGGLIAAQVIAAQVTAAPAQGAVEDELLAALDLGAGADVVLIELPTAKGAPRVRAAAAVRAAPATLNAVLMDPERFGAVFPAMVRSEVLPPAGGTVPGKARQVAWELEVPLFNLSGTYTLRPLADGIEMLLTDGDLAPGRVTFRATPRAGGRATLMVDAQVDVRRSSFFIRRVMARSALGEPAALAAAAFVALRATALRAEHAGAATAWRPTEVPAPPAAWLPDARGLADPRLAPLRARGAVALVARTPGERLAGVAVARDSPYAAAALTNRLRDPAYWRRFPGWKKVDVGKPAAAGAPASATVEDSVPFVDLDATWRGLAGPGARWVASDGAASGARLGWTVLPTGPAASVVVLSLYPRLEQTGGVPRRLLAGEPLLEHGLALSLAFVDALGAIP